MILQADPDKASPALNMCASVWVGVSLTFEETILLSGNLCCIKASVPGGGSLCPM